MQLTTLPFQHRTNIGHDPMPNPFSFSYLTELFVSLQFHLALRIRALKHLCFASGPQTPPPPFRCRRYTKSSAGCARPTRRLRVDDSSDDEVDRPPGRPTLGDLTAPLRLRDLSVRRVSESETSPLWAFDQFERSMSGLSLTERGVW